MAVLGKFTWKTLLKNRTRTVVTLIGIALSMALLTAVIEGAYSGMQYMIRGIEAEDGRYHGYFYGIEAEDAGKVRDLPEVTETAVLTEVGWAEIGSTNPGKPYLLVSSADEHLEELAAVCLIEGRMPENDSEILLPEHLSTNGEVFIRVGDTLDLALGKRYVGGAEAHEDVKYGGESGEEPDEIRGAVEKHYTVVGIYQRFSSDVEYMNCPGYTALTKGAAEGSARVFFRLKDPVKFDAFERQYRESVGAIQQNSMLLTCYGSFGDSGLRQVVYGFIGILVFLVALGSISLIYNAFSISVGERTRQYGILKSVGATKRQIRHTVFMEALMLSIIAIPAGLLVGCVGIGLTLYFLRDAFSSMFEAEVPEKMHLVLNTGALGLAAGLSLLTVLISALIPARRAIRVSPMESIRETADVRIRPRAVRTSKLTQKLFGFEGTMASKNFKRDRRRYRSTVVSLSLSIVLFISASGFTSYLKKSGEDVGAADVEADVTYSTSDCDREELIHRFNTVAAMPGVTDCTMLMQLELDSFVPKESLSESFLDNPYEGINAEGGLVEYYIPVVFLDDAHFDAWAKEQGIQPESLETDGIPRGVLFNRIHSYVYTEEGRIFYSFEVMDRDALPSVIQLYREEPQLRLDFTVGALAEELPMGAFRTMSPYLIYPVSAMEKLYPDELPGLLQGGAVCVRTANHTETADRIEKMIRENGYPAAMNAVTDHAASNENIRMAILVINVFSYGFIILISLIGVANVFNTISTNILLRRREFAMLKSVGLSENGFRKMLNYECLIYGLRGLLFGLPASVPLTYVVYRITGLSFEVPFYIPWQSVLIAVGSVFLVVFCSMVYARRKLALDNPIDALKLA